MHRTTVLAITILLGACKPPASDDYLARAQTSEVRTSPREPMASPESEGAAWALGQSGRLLYGQPGEAPYFALGCEDGALVFTRFAAADPGAKAVLALIGNGHVERLWIDAEQEADDVWLWRGRVAADDPRLEVLTGPRQVEATVPGAGSLKLNPSNAPRDYIAECASGIVPEPAPEASAT